MVTPILGDLISNTIGNTVNKVVGGLVDKYLPKSMSEAEKADVKLQMRQFAADEMKNDTSIVQAVNATMQVEARSDKWYVSGWRPFWGFTSGFAFLFVIILVCYLTWLAVLGGKPEAMAMIPQVIASFAALFAIPGAILGVSAWHRGKKQRIEAGEQPAISSNMLAGVLNKLKDKL